MPGAGSGDKHNPARGVCAVMVVVWVLLSISGCAGTAGRDPQLPPIAPLNLPGGSLTAADAAPRISTPDLLALDDEMREFVSRYTGDLRMERQRLQVLHRALKSPALLNLDYDPAADGTAVDVFRRGSANCLSYASLFVALAREAGLDADYQWLEVRPQWSRLGEHVAVRLHVNVVVDTRLGDRFMVDIDPLQSRDIAGTRRLADNEAAALHHNNLAMQALGERRLDEAWLQLVRGLHLAPDMTPLWVNLGAVYRAVGQHADAESSYLHALELDEQDRSAMTNLMVLYGLEGRTEEQDQWAARVERYRRANPYYHVWLGEQAEAEENWAGALAHYERALALAPGESHLLYTTGVLHYRLGNYPAATDHLSRAVETAKLLVDRERYQAQLERVRQDQLAGV